MNTTDLFESQANQPPMTEPHHAQGASTREEADFFSEYLDTLSLIERLHRLLLEVVGDEFRRLGISDINSVQALLIFNIGDHEVTAGELKARGYYQGSNVSYNLKKLVDSGYIRHERCSSDRRAVRISLTPEGYKVHGILRSLWMRQIGEFEQRDLFDCQELMGITQRMRKLQRFWNDGIRYIR